MNMKPVILLRELLKRPFIETEKSTYVMRDGVVLIDGYKAMTINIDTERINSISDSEIANIINAKGDNA